MSTFVNVLNMLQSGTTLDKNRTQICRIDLI